MQQLCSATGMPCRGLVVEGEGWRGELVLVFATKGWKVAKLGDSLAMESCTLIWALVPKRAPLQGCRPPGSLRLASCHTIPTVECRLAVGKAIHHERISQAILLVCPWAEWQAGWPQLSLRAHLHPHRECCRPVSRQGLDIHHCGPLGSGAHH